MFKYVMILLLCFGVVGCRDQDHSEDQKNDLKTKHVDWRTLTAEEKHVIVDEGTERPFSGTYHAFYEVGTYTCKRCGHALYDSDAKFDSRTGWPSFDVAIEGGVLEKRDHDGRRIELECKNCGGHLGHLFKGEEFTKKNTRHCINSISMVFIAGKRVKMKEAYFGGGCFWGVEYFLEKLEGVTDVESGYMGGTTEHPTYQEVCDGKTGHVEIVRVVYDSSVISYDTLTRHFFEIHDPTQKNGQGPDIGEQYFSVIFYNNDTEKEIARNLIHILESKDFDIATRLREAGPFWKAEDYHQDYYTKSKKKPYCHAYRKRF